MLSPLMSFSPIAGGLYLGWTLGANDAANIFGTAVAARIITFKKACIISSFFIIIGAVSQGYQGIETVSNITSQTISTAFIITVAAAFTVTIMTLLSLPVSTSQAMVGAVLGIGFATGDVNLYPLVKVIVCWLLTPVGSMIVAMAIYKVLGFIIDYWPMSILTRDKILWSGLLIVGIYGSYALGANNVTVSTGVFSGLLAGVSDFVLALTGGIAIASGVITFSRRVIRAVGREIMPLNAFTAFISVFSMALTVHIFAFVGVPVSTSQAIIGAIAGVAIIRGINPFKNKKLKYVIFGWLMTPLISLILAAAGYAIFG